MTDDPRDLLAKGAGVPGDVEPVQRGLTALTLPDLDGREHALRRLRQFVAALVFRRRGRVPGQFVEFQIAETSFHLYEPDDIRTIQMPAIGVIGAEEVNEPFGLGPNEPDEETYGEFAPGTVVVSIGENVERVVLEVWARKHAERRAIVAGLKRVMRATDDATRSLRLSLPDYFGAVAQFTLIDARPVDDNAPQSRRRALLTVEMRVPELMLVDAVPFKPSATVELGVGVVDPLDE